MLQEPEELCIADPIPHVLHRNVSLVQILKRREWGGTSLKFLIHNRATFYIIKLRIRIRLLRLRFQPDVQDIQTIENFKLRNVAVLCLLHQTRKSNRLSPPPLL
jgi:hypothetical protein